MHLRYFSFSLIFYTQCIKTPPPLFSHISALFILACATLLERWITLLRLPSIQRKHQHQRHKQCLPTSAPYCFWSILFDSILFDSIRWRHLIRRWAKHYEREQHSGDRGVQDILFMYLKRSTHDSISVAGCGGFATVAQHVCKSFKQKRYQNKRAFTWNL